MNQIKNIGISENTKQSNFSGNNATVKRNSSTEINISSTKKIKLEVSNSTLWNTEGTLIKKSGGDSSKDELSRTTFKRECIAKTFPNFQNQDCEISTERGKVPFNTIRNLSRTLNSSSPSSPLNAEDYVVIASNLTDYIDDKDCDRNNKRKQVSETNCSVVNVTGCSRKEINSKCSGQIDSANSGLSPINQEGNTSEIDLVMLPSIQEQKSTPQLPNNSDSNGHSGTSTRIVASSANIMRQGTVTYTRITTAGTISTGLPSNATVLNRMNISPTLKNQQVMVTTKKLASEVTQTTAKVSIGNTTISVPLLKPLNSTQLMHPANSGHCELQKQSQTTTATSAQPLSTQTQINLSKILNAKRGHKGSHPTIVSLSQLQIKPVSTTKLVQTKVFSKKLPQVQCTATTNSQPNSGLVTIAVSKAKQNIALTQSGQKKSNINFKPDSGGTFNNAFLDDGSSIPERNFSMESGDFVNEKVEKQTGECNMLDPSISLNLGSIEKPLKIMSPVTDEMALNKTTATIKKVLNPNVNILPLLTPLSKNSEQQANTGIYPAVSIIRQTAPQLITTSATTTCVSVSTSASDTNFQTDYPGTKSTNLNNLCGKLNTTSLISIPKNISLVLSKNNISQQAKATIMSANSIRNTTSIDQKVKKINLTVSSALNVTAVNSMNVTQSFNNNNSSPTPNQSHSQEVNQVNKSTVISVAVQPHNYINSSDQSLLSRKTVKVTPYTLSTLGHHLDKRCKAIEAHEQDNHQNAEILPAKRSKHDNPENTTDILESTDKKDSTDNSHSLGDAKSLINIDKHGNIEINQSSIIVAKSEESNNVLLKKLLQNSSSSHNVNVLPTSVQHPSTSSATASICNQVLPARKVINVRAPSLGLVSSLEAQLARPVIPPVPANTSTQVQSDISKSQKNDIQEELLIKVNNENVSTQNDAKIKSVQVISKETSFVSNPNISPFLLDDMRHPKISLAGQATEQESTNKSNLIITCDKNDTNNKTHQNNSHDTSPIGSNGTDFKERGNTQENRSQSSQVHATIRSDIIKEQNLGKETTTIFSSDRKEDINTENVSSFGTSISAVTPINENGGNLESLKTVNKPTKTYKSNLLDASGKSKVPSKYDNVGLNVCVSSSVNIKLDNVCANESSLLAECNVPATSATQKAIIIDKDIESRKKRKREYQKHRRQLLSGKELTANTVNSTSSVPGSKKKSRKLSKIEEDYDNFIDNLMVNLKQMKPLQVLEPLLNRNFVVCSTYGLSSNLPRGVNSKENGDIFLTPPLLGEYGNAHRSNAVTLYDSGPFFSSECTKEKQLSTIQNDFYDQEFLPNIRNNYDRFLRIWGIIKERNIESSEIITNSNADIATSMGDKINRLSLHQFIYPGLVVMNKNSDHYIDRMSPSVPFIEPTFNAKKSCFVKSLNNIDDIENVKQVITPGSDTRTKCDDSNNRVVTLSLQLSAVNNIFGVLKDLANLLHIPAPSMYKIIDAPLFNLCKDFSPKNNNKLTVKSQISFQQDVICGRKRVCYNCGAYVSEVGNQAFKVPFCDIKGISNSTLSPNLPPMKLEFCGKYCYEQFQCPNKTQFANLTSNMEEIQTSVEKKCSNENTNVNRTGGKQSNTIKKPETKACSYKHYNAECFKELQKIIHVSENEANEAQIYINDRRMDENCEKSGFASCILNSNFEDMRQCVFCYQRGDGVANGPSRLLNFDIDKWVHLNCALWSSEVYETISGGLMNFPAALQVGLNQSCSGCQQLGATVRCFKNRCTQVFHLPCAIREHCVFYKNKTIHCQQHANRLEKENELTSLIVQRRVFVERDENRQVATVMHHSELTNLLRVGTLTFLNIGQLLPHQLEAFHNMDHIYPVGYKVIRFYWSMKRSNRRCRYICSIAEVASRPEFRIQVQEPGNEIELRDSSPNAVWKQILAPIALMRKNNKVVQLFPQFISGEDLFGLTEPSVVRIIESLPGIETLTNYRFKYGRNPLLELPLAINPSGSARTEPKQRQIVAWRKPHTQRTGSTANQRMANSTTSTIAGEIACPYSKQFVHSKSSQYKKMKQEWRNNVYLARSKIQGLGLYAARDIEKHTMIIEYIGEVIRTEVSEIREKQYEAKNRGIYMFRLDEDRVVDATLSGGLARYINHACNPNCVTETVDVDRELRIIIFAKRRINRGEELSYDYKFDIEDDAHKISCMCGAANCRKWMN
ncbi:histone-lysine N-methyltransferase trr isoform X1 [Anastrepha obliqua]|uniref:histone-lysine N-methyltransferase trr isoform X1 n=1 Tax=Anastrepha obliqua TaxID=95512 RepID=UPI0024095CBA|nr:histone-lysine N-methyltransferase trr isoform X1 [Anastrepha obliqua]